MTRAQNSEKLPDMKMAGFTKQERSLILLARILAVVFLSFGILSILAPDYSLNYITDIGRWLLGWHSPAIKLGSERFWLVPTVSLNISLAYLCFVVQGDAVHNLEYVRILLIATFTCAAGFALCLVASSHQFFYLIGACTEGAIFIIALLVYRSAVQSRNKWS